MNEAAVRTPMQYLDKAVGALRDMGLMPAKLEPAPINALLEKISDLEPDKVQVKMGRGGATSTLAIDIELPN